MNIKNETELKKAIKIVKLLSHEFIIEKHMEGHDFRVLMIGNKMAACALREPPNVIGDGIHTIEELIEIKNNHPYRGEINQKNTTLHKIKISGQLEDFIQAQGLFLETVIEAGKKVYLGRKVILASGADIHDVTERVHWENKKIFEELSLKFDAPIIGFDVITTDISKPYFNTNFAIIEANGLPFVDIHHFPVSGEKRNVAALILDEFENRFT